MTLTVAPNAVESRPAAGERPLRAWQKGLLVLGLAWALLVILPDFTRLHWPLADFSFSADNSGHVFRVEKPNAYDRASTGEPAPDVAVGDRILLRPGACWSPGSDRCRNFLAIFGGMGGLSYVRPGTVVTLPILRANGTQSEITVAATPAPLGPIAALLLALDEIAAVIVICMAFKLAWDRPGPMTVGFFLFAMWFNPGQYFAFYAWLQAHPVLLLVQEVLQALAQGAGYAGFLIFALRFPRDHSERRLRRVEWIAIGIGASLAAFQLASFTNVFGVPTEIVTRCAILGGYAVALLAFLIVLYRIHDQSPLEYQRMRWVLWGCAIGLPAYIFADGNEATSLWDRYVWSLPVWKGWSPGEATFELGYLLSGLMTIFICAAVRQRRILNVTFELRALAATGLVLVVGFFIEEEIREPMEAIFGIIGVPEDVQFWLSVVPLIAFGIAAHEGAHNARHLFNPRFRRESRELADLCSKAERAATMEEIDAMFADGPCNALGLASAKVLRDQAGTFSVVASAAGSTAGVAPVLNATINAVLLADLGRGSAVPLPPPPETDDAAAQIEAPALAVPAIFGDKLYAFAMYGTHDTGAAIDRLEVQTLQEFARHVAVGYERVSKAMLEREVAALRQQLAMTTGASH